MPTPRQSRSKTSVSRSATPIDTNPEGGAQCQPLCKKVGPAEDASFADESTSISSDSSAGPLWEPGMAEASPGSPLG